VNASANLLFWPAPAKSELLEARLTEQANRKVNPSKPAHLVSGLQWFNPEVTAF